MVLKKVEYVGPEPSPRLGKEDRFPVLREIEERGPVEPRQLMFAGPAFASRHDSDPDRVMGHEGPAVRRDVLERQALRDAREHALFPCEGDRVQRAIGAHLGGREPDFVPLRRPGDAPLRGVALRQRALLAGAVDHRHHPAVVAPLRMLHERHQVAFRRDPRVAHPSGRLIENLSDRVLELAAQSDFADDRHLAAAGAPVGPVHVLLDLARSDAAADADLGERAVADERHLVVSVQRDGHLAGLRDPEEIRPDQTEDT